MDFLKEDTFLKCSQGPSWDLSKFLSCSLLIFTVKQWKQWGILFRPNTLLVVEPVGPKNYKEKNASESWKLNLGEGDHVSKIKSAYSTPDVISAHD